MINIEWLWEYDIYKNNLTDRFRHITGIGALKRRKIFFSSHKWRSINVAV